jgi:hypothetical protein
MSRIRDQIEQQVQEIRHKATQSGFPESAEPLVIVPFVSKRCIAYCGAGRCNCHPTIGHHFCLVFESRLKNCSSEFVSEIEYLQDQVNKVSVNLLVAESEQLQVIDDAHLALILAK